MNKLGALVEKRGVVLIALNHEILGIVQPRAFAKILWNAANHITWFASGFLHDPGKQRGRGGFTVRTGDDQIMATPQEKIPEDFWQREIRQFSVEHGFHFRVP